MKPAAIFLYELSGKSAEPFAAAGWDCYCIDIQHKGNRTEGNVHFVQADARRWKPTRDMVERCRFFAAFPPCDDLATSGARWFKGKGLHALADAIDLFAIAAEWAEFFEVPYLIENATQGGGRKNAILSPMRSKRKSSAQPMRPKKANLSGPTSR